MKNFEMKELGIKEMNAEELTNVNGGGFTTDVLEEILLPVESILSKTLDSTPGILGTILGNL